jgi:DNA polymerase-3 subunit epsilon
MKIVSLDFETANYSPVSICAAGVAVFVDGDLVDSQHWLVKPPKGHGFFKPEWTEQCHGISHHLVRNEPEFSVIAPEILSYLTQADLVAAHNASFDLPRLRAVLSHYGMSCPPLRSVCTLKLARKVWPQLPNHQLSTICAHIGHQFIHHQARSDAEAAGRVLLAMLELHDDLLAEHSTRKQPSKHSSPC